MTPPRGCCGEAAMGSGEDMTETQGSVPSSEGQKQQRE